MDTRDDTLSIGELAGRTHASARALRHYDQQGLLPSMRTAAGHRRFSSDAVETVRRIRMFLGAGLPLSIVGKVLPCFTGQGQTLDPCVSEYLRDHLRTVQQRITAFDEQRRVTERLQQLVAPSDEGDLVAQTR